MTPKEHLAKAQYFYDHATVPVDSFLLASIAQSLLAIATRMVNQEQEANAMASKVPRPVSKPAEYDKEFRNGHS